jgi:predicted DNA-binding transcriptional regulator AlpA
LEASLSEYLTIDDLAERYGISKKTVYDWRYRGVGPASVKLGGIRFHVDDVKRWEEEQAAKEQERASQRLVRSKQVRSQLMDPQSRTWSLVAVPAMATTLRW